MRTFVKALRSARFPRARSLPTTILVLLLLALCLPTSAGAQDESTIYLPLVYGESTDEIPPQPVAYSSFDGVELILYAHPGSEVSLLVDDADLERATMRQIVSTFDDAWRYYRAATGRAPMPYRMFDDTATIAVVPSTCNGITTDCGFLGATGIEVTPPIFDDLYSGVHLRSEYDQTIFHTMGRNFWFFTEQLEYKGEDNTRTVTTGYAAFMRFMAMDAAGAAPGPIYGQDPTLYRAGLVALLDRYLADPTLNWENTLRIGRAPANTQGMSGPEFFASFLFALKERYGEPFVAALWHEAATLPAAESTQAAVDNFVRAASAAAGEDLAPLFRDEWRWPVSPATP